MGRHQLNMGRLGAGPADAVLRVRQASVAARRRPRSREMGRHGRISAGARAGALLDWPHRMRLAPPAAREVPRIERRAPRPEPAPGCSWSGACSCSAQSGRAPPGSPAARLAAVADRRAGRPVQPRRADRPGQPPQLRAGAGPRSRPRGPQRRAGAAAGARHRPLQAHQRHLRPRRRRPGDPAVAHALVDSVRPMDLVARMGGEEFAIMLPNCPSAFGATVAERVRRRIEHMPVHRWAPGPADQVTVSIGGAFAPQWVRSTPALWMERADQQLYRAKAEGRNLCCLEPVAVSLVSNEEKACCSTPFSSRTTNEPPPFPRPAAPPPRRRCPAGRAHHRHHQRQGRRGQDLPRRQPGRGAGPAGERVLVLDADLGLANLDVVLNLYPKITLHDVFTGKHAGRGHPAGARAASRCCWPGSGMVEYSRMTPEVRDKLQSTWSSRVRARASTMCCWTPAPASPTWCCTPCRWPTRCWWSPRPSPPR
jgi:hypothetical protein